MFCGQRGFHGAHGRENACIASTLLYHGMPVRCRHVGYECHRLSGWNSTLWKRDASGARWKMQNCIQTFCVKLSINNHIVGLVHKNDIIRTCLMKHAACKESWVSTIQTIVLTADVFQLFILRSKICAWQDWDFRISNKQTATTAATKN